MINKYIDFLLEKQKLWVPFILSNELKSFIKDIESPITTELLRMYEDDIATDKSYVDIIEDKNDQWSFLAADRAYKIGEYKLEYDKTDFKDDLSKWHKDIFYKSKLRTTAGIGRLINGVISDKNIASSQNIEKFLTAYKAKHNTSFGIDNIQVVKGEDIRKWYLVDNYEDTSGKTTLGKSCMRYQKCQDYLDIYVKNSQVSMLIKLNDEGKLCARSILWESGDNKYIDRIYYTKEEYRMSMNKWAEKNGYKSPRGWVNIKLDNTDFSEYPYMDTFYIVNKNTNEIVNYEDVSNREDWIKCQNTDGSYEDLNSGCWSDRDGRYYDEEDAIWIDSISDYVHRDDACYVESRDQYYLSDDCRYSDRRGEYYHSDDVYYSEYLDDYIPDEEVVYVKMDIGGRNEDYFFSDQDGEYFRYDDDEGEAYFIKLWFKCDGEWYFMGQDLKVGKDEDGNLIIDEDGGFTMTGEEYFKHRFSTDKTYEEVYNELENYYIKRSKEEIEKCKDPHSILHDTFYLKIKEKLDEQNSEKNEETPEYSMEYVFDAIIENIERSFRNGTNTDRVRMSKPEFTVRLDSACSSLMRHINQVVDCQEYIYKYNLARYGEIKKLTLADIINGK